LLRVTLNINQPTNQPTNRVLAMFMELRTDSGSMSTSRAHLHLCCHERTYYLQVGLEHFTTICRRQSVSQSRVRVQKLVIWRKPVSETCL